MFLFFILLISAIPSVHGQNQVITSLDVDLTWNTMITNRKTAISSLPAYADFPDNATSWTDYAEKSFEELLIEDDCWISEGSVDKGFRPYVKGADGWGPGSWVRTSTELMAGIDVLWPMYRYLQLNPNSTREDNVTEFIVELQNYYAPTLKQTLNNPASGSTNSAEHDSWYYVENSILKFGHLFKISNITALEEPYLNSLESGLEMAHNLNYLFPQFVDASTKRATKNTNINYGTAGLLAYSLVDAYELTHDITYLEEAETALIALRGVEPPYDTAYEPQEIAAGVAAAARMIQYANIIGSTTDFAQMAVDLFYAEEQTLYYDGGKIDWTFGPKGIPGAPNPGASPWLPTSWRDGMHSPYSNPRELGSGGIDAPAYKENIEAIMFWADYLKNIYFYDGFKAVEPLKIINLNRIKNFYFFSPNIPDQYERSYGPVTLQYIPYEDIDYHDVRTDKEDETQRYKAGYNGKEIYGAGETLWNYLMFEALGESSDNKTLIINLNVFEKDYPSARNDRKYIVFNPYDEQKTLTFTLKHLSEAYNLYSNNTLLSNNIQPGNSFNITLPALGSAYITLTDPTITGLPTTTIPDGSNLVEQIGILGFIGFSIIAIVIVLYFVFKPKT
jgi:hypothetical protein